MKVKPFHELTILDVYPDQPSIIKCSHCGSENVKLGLHVSFGIQHAGRCSLYGYDCQDCKEQSIFPVKERN